MTRKLHHPLWTHLGAVALYLWLLISLWRTYPLPPRVPVHFGLAGRPDRWGSPWEVVIGTLLAPLFIIALSAFMDELWARHERGKTFNWVSLFDEITLGFLAGIVLEQLDVIRRGEGARFTVPWTTMLVLILAAVAVAILLERLRPWHATEEPIVATEVSEVAVEMAARAQEGKRWAYWETQNPPYVFVVALLCAATFIVPAVLLWPQLRYQLPWLPPVFALLGLSMLIMCGGLRVSVTAERVEIRLGFLGLRLLRVHLPDIESVEIRTFSPLGDFGGWGIRYNGKQWAFFLRGTSGVSLRVKNGKEWIIGSDHPERLAAVITAAREHA